MANNYTQFSFAISDITPEHANWIHAVLAGCNESTVGTGNPGPYPDVVQRLLEGDAMFPDVQATYAGDTKEMVFYAEEHGDVEYTANLIHEYLKAFDLDRAVGFEWSETCSQPRINEFGGGAVFITKRDVLFMNTTEWIGRKMRAWSDKDEIELMRP